MKSIKETDVKGKRVIVRAGFDVLDKNGNITNFSRLQSMLPTLQYLVEQEAKVIVISHNGKPKGKVVPELSMKVVAEEMAKPEYLNRQVDFINNCTGDDVTNYIAGMAPGQIVFLENLRFYKEEKENNPEFAKKLSDLADIYVNDAWPVCHREHASIVGIPKLLPHYAGLALLEEVNAMRSYAKNPQHPFVLIIGGKKADKADTIEAMLHRVDKFIVTGGLANTFLKSIGYNIGNSLCDDERLEQVNRLYEDNKDKFVLPIDVVCGNIETGEVNATFPIAQIPEDTMILDMGPESVENYKKFLGGAAQILWGGPMGVFEQEAFAAATKEIGAYLSGLTNVRIIGGGETGTAAERFGYKAKMTHCSDGGGATLEFFEGKELVGILALK